MKQNSIKAEIEKGFAHTLNIDVKNLPSDFSTEITSKLLGVKDGTLAVWRCTKRYPLPYYKIGSNVRYPLFGLIKFKLDSLKEVHNEI